MSGIAGIASHHTQKPREPNTRRAGSPPCPRAGASRPSKSTPAHRPDPTTGARAVPIYQTTSFVFRDTAHAAALFGLEELGMIYTRIMNPTQAVFEDRVTALEGGVGRARGRERASGAVPGAVEPRRERRPHRVVGVALRRHVQPAPLHVPEARRARSASSTTPTTSTRGAPRSGRTRRRSTARSSATRRATSSISRASQASAHDNGIPLVIDNTLATPYLCRPFEHGADIVVHSATKFIGGHGTSIGGIIVDGGKFDYVASGRFPGLHRARPELSRPDLLAASRGAAAGAVHLEGPRCSTSATSVPALSPFNEFLFLQGLETLSLRMERHSREHARDRAVARSTRRGGVGEVPGSCVEPVERARQEVPAERVRRDRRVRDQGWTRGGPEVRGRARAAQPPRQRG